MPAWFGVKTRDREYVEWKMAVKKALVCWRSPEQTRKLQCVYECVAVVAPGWSHRQNTREEKKKEKKVGCYVLGGT